MPETPERLDAARAPWTVRVASWSARHRWPVFVLWFLFTIGLFGASLAVGGTRSQEAVSRDVKQRYESLVAYDVFNAGGVQAPAQASLLLVVRAPGTGTVDEPSTAAVIGDIVGRLKAVQADVAGTTEPVFSEVIDPLTAPPAFALVSPDRTTVRISATMLGEGPVINDRLEPIPALVTDLRAAHPSFEIHALNNTLANREISDLVNADLDGSLRLTIPLAFVILLIAFGAAVAAFVPLVLAITSLLAAFGLLAIYSQVVSPVSPYANQLVVLIGLAVAVDYSLFMLTRFRAERRRGRDKLEAIGVASSTAGRAIFFSGLAVMISIAGLFLLDDPLFRSMAIGTIAVVLIAVIGSLTFLPATMAILDRGIDRLRIPYFGRERSEGLGFWSSIVRFAMRRAVPVVAVVAIGLIGVASPVTRLHIGQSDFASFPDTLDAVQAVNLLTAKWPQGTTLTLDVVVTKAPEPATKTAVTRLGDELLKIPGLSGPIETRASANGQSVLVSAHMSGGENDVANREIVREVRTRLVPAVFGGLPDVRAYTTGDAAYVADIVGFYESGMPLVFAFVLGLSFLLLLVAFHSIVIPIKAILLNLLSTGAAYGLTVLVFQDGWLHEQLGFKPGTIEAFIPIFIFTILFGLSMDYHVFILTRIKEARDRGLPSNAAVERGISITSGTITSAAAIMVVVFAVFVTLQLVVIRQLGFGLAVAVLIDATVVRSLLLPATMRLLGEWNWWMPRFLRWIPRVTIEGPSDEPEAPSAATA